MTIITQSFEITTSMDGCSHENDMDWHKQLLSWYKQL
jgi:hypothetical protein